jgi:hypothetical protein
MIDEGKLRTQLNAGIAADRELKQTAEAFGKLREEYTKAWMVSDARDTAGREKIWLATTILTRVEEMLRTTVTNGRVAEKELEALRKAGEPKKTILGIPVH